MNKSAPPHKTPPLIHVATWNVLAIIATLRALQAQIICLQELEPALMLQIRDQLHRDHYMVHYAQRPNRPDGSAILYDRRLFACNGEQITLYDDLAPGPEPTDRVALTLKLQLLAHPCTSFNVSSTHLKWSPPQVPAHEHNGYRQLMALLEVLDEDGDLPQILAGDLNVRPDSPAIALAIQRGFVDTLAAQPQAYTANTHQDPKRIDYILLRHLHAVQTRVLGTLTASTVMPSEHFASDHLPLLATLREIGAPVMQ